ncbi:MAG: carbohydrate ABC transporter substrate-binding protein [Lachnospiraceae bacterium]|nr:carbohydrate ABC transporter substrate-binding protein [Lachnospiraceae bacterium]
MKKKLVSTLLSVAMVSSLLAGCGATTAPAEEAAPATEEAAPAEEAAAEETGEGQVVKVAAVETAYGADIWKNVAAEFEAATGITVELTVDKNLEDVISPDMKAGNYPDVIMRAVGAESGMTETFIKDNNLVDLSDVMDLTVPGETAKVSDKMLGGFTNNTITQPYGDGKIYLMPMFYSPCGLFYNAGLFAEKGWEVPTTWDEMWALGDTAKAEGISLFTYPTAGYFDAFLYALMHEAFGDNFANVLQYGEGVWETPEAETIFAILDKLATYTEPTTPANANDDNFQKNQQLVLDNKALFMPNGNWVIGEMAEAPRADGFEWGFTALPAVEDGGERASYAWFEQVWMPGGAVNVDAGKQFIAFLYSDAAAAIFAEKGAIQPINGLADTLEGDAKIYYSIYDTGAVAVLDAFAATESIEGTTIRGTFCDPINSLVTKDKTIDDWKAQIIKDNDTFRANLKQQ